MNHYDSWEQRLRDGLERCSVPPPADMWERIERELDGKEAAAPAATAGRRVLMRRLLVGVCATSAACLLLVFLPHRPSGNGAGPASSADGQVAGASHHRSVPSARPHVEPSQQAGEEAQGRVPTLVARLRRKLATLPSETDVLTNANTSVATLALARKDDAQPPAQADTLRGATAPDEPLRVAPAARAARKATSAAFADASLSVPTPARKPTLAFAMQGLAMGGRWKADGGGSYSKLYFAPIGSEDVADNTDTVATRQRASSFHTTAGTRQVRHKFPVRIALVATFPIAERWAIDCGLTYTRRESELTATGIVRSHQVDETLHFVGVRVSAAYMAYRSRPLSLYVSGGVQGELCVSGTQSYRPLLSEQANDAAPHSCSVGHGLWVNSLVASAGVQWNAGSRVGVFAEPGLSYQLPCGSHLVGFTDYSPWQFNMLVGLRFMLGR